MGYAVGVTIDVLPVQLAAARATRFYPATMAVTTFDRIVGCLKGIATGDAIGKQTEGLSREDVLRWYPQGIQGFEGTTL